MQNSRRLRLRFALKIAQPDQLLIVRRQRGDRLLQAQTLGDSLLHICDRHICLRIAVRVVHGSEGERQPCTADGVRHLLRRHAQPCRQLAHRQLCAVLPQIFRVQPCDFERERTERPADLDRPAVAEQPLDLSGDHRKGIGGKLHAAAFVKAVERLGEPQAAGGK